MSLFLCDYQEGAHPAIMKALNDTNFVQTPGYGEDIFCEEARELIKKAVGTDRCDVHFLVGGTQTNTVVIKSALRPHQGVIAASTGHINVHETGAIEAVGHKVLTIAGHDGKICAEDIRRYCASYYADSAWEHIVMPGMVYISFPTELGTIYSKAELEAIRGVCKEYSMYLFIDGARLGYGLKSPSADITLPELASLCDVFYIGGTKVGALFGEAVVIMNDELKKDFRCVMKQHGGMLAKGRLLGIQFRELFRNGLYFEISENAIEKAGKLREIFAGRGYGFYADSPTNQQFPILPAEVYEKVRGICELWADMPDGSKAVRFCTSWCTGDEQLRELEELLDGTE